MINVDFLYGFYLELLEFADGECFDFRERPSISQLKNTRPLIDGLIIERVFTTENGIRYICKDGSSRDSRVVETPYKSFEINTAYTFKREGVAIRRPRSLLARCGGCRKFLVEKR